MRRPRNVLAIVFVVLGVLTVVATVAAVVMMARANAAALPK